MNLLPTTTEKEVLHKNLDVWLSLGKLGHLQHPIYIPLWQLFFSSWVAEACFRPGVGGLWEWALGKRPALPNIPLRWAFNHWDCAVGFQDPLPPLLSCLAPVGTWVFDPCSCQAVFLVGSTLVLCSCCFFGMSFPFGLACPNLNLITPGQAQGPVGCGVSHGCYGPSSSAPTRTAWRSIWFYTLFYCSVFHGFFLLHGNMFP